MKKFLLIFVVMLLAACVRQGAEYLGKWQTDDGKHILDISQNGDSLLLQITEPSFKGGFISQPGDSTTTAVPATVKDGILKIDGPFGGVAIVYVKQSDSLLFPSPMGGNIEYKRTK